MTANTSHGSIRGERPRRQVRPRTGLEIRDDLFKDRVLSVGFIRGHSIKQTQVSGGEHRMKPVQIKQSRLIHIFLIQLRDAADHQAPGEVFGTLPGGQHR